MQICGKIVTHNLQAILNYNSTCSSAELSRLCLIFPDIAVTELCKVVLKQVVKSADFHDKDLSTDIFFFISVPGNDSAKIILCNLVCTGILAFLLLFSSQVESLNFCLVLKDPEPFWRNLVPNMLSTS